jgi:glycerol-3-phosphate dehydrogenase
LYAFCAAHNVPHDRCGKLVVASSEEEIPKIEALARLGTSNGAEGLEIVDRPFIRAREPHVDGLAALWSPATGRVEAEGLVRALLRMAENNDAVLLRGTTVIGGDISGSGFAVRTEQESIAAHAVVNAAGLVADEISAMLGGETFRIYACRGEYAELRRSKSHWLNGLVYPLPHAQGHGLGVHLTKTTGGAVLLGPTARFQEDKDDYESNRMTVEEFLEPVRLLMPAVTLDDLTYGGSGIRPKLHGPEGSFADFMIKPDENNGALIQAAGIDSPGLTSCLAIGARVAALVADVLD